MSLINIIAVALVVLIMVMTFISEPRVSMQYFKAAGSSVSIVLGKIKDVIGGWISEHNQKVNEDGKEE